MTALVKVASISLTYFCMSKFLWMHFPVSVQESDLFRLVSDTDRNLNTKELKYNACMWLRENWISAVICIWAQCECSQPICLAFLKMYCTVSHSSHCGLTSPTEDNRQPARVTSRKTRVETLQKWVYSIHPTPLGAPCTSSRLKANQVLQVLCI